jgi:uncharacterized membrane-anchored protein
MRNRAFLVVVAVLGLLPLGLAGWGELQLRRGQHVLIPVVPVDPHDLFRGEYVALSYGISSLPASESVEPGDTVYVSLDGPASTWSDHWAMRHHPARGRFIRGTVEYGGQLGQRARIRYGIETFYVEEGKAIDYERAIRSRNLYADVSIAGDGKARLARLVVKP